MKFIVKQPTDTAVLLSVNGFELVVSASESGLEVQIAKNGLNLTGWDFAWDDEHDCY